ncbi:MAG: FAD-dependent oxidoreductase [Opitutales bacterium]
MTKQKTIKTDILIYGGTSAGIAAAVAAARRGVRPLLVEASDHLGGMTTGGLGDTDVGIASAIGGISLEFYERVGKIYGEENAAWRFEPKVAMQVFSEMLREQGVEVLTRERLDLEKGVVTKDGNIVLVRMESGLEIEAKRYIDTSYEGDLMALAGVTYVIGREANALHGETLNGIRDDNELPDGVDPYVIPGRPESGLLERVNPNRGGEVGDADNGVQAYTYRMCLTDVPENRAPIYKPVMYREADYEILFRAIEQGQTRRFFKLERVPNGKTDSNNDSGISTDFIGMNHIYPEADYQTRGSIAAEQTRYQLGLVWTLQNHPRVPEAIREFYAPWGLPKDEFAGNNHWPTQLYVREARRMLGEHLITENVVRSKAAVADSIGLGSYAMDSHHIQYCVSEKGDVTTEGGFYVILDSPYSISYRSILPRAKECRNLLVPVCLSATHAAYGSVRMEPVFMILGQSAATAAALSIQRDCDLHELPYAVLQAALENGKQRLHAQPGACRH